MTKWIKYSGLLLIAVFLIAAKAMAQDTNPDAGLMRSNGKTEISDVPHQDTYPQMLAPIWIR